MELRATPKLLAYLDRLVRNEGYGSTRQEVIKTLVWQGINELIAQGRVKEFP